MDELTEYEGCTLRDGMWKDAYTRHFSVGRNRYVVEISNYPRAYRRTRRPAYTEDEPFTVTHDDLNDYNESGDFIHRDIRGNETKLGKTATHWKTDPLPGQFPRWCLFEKPQKPTDLTKIRFDFTVTPKPMAIIANGILNEQGLTNIAKVSITGDEVVNPGPCEPQIIYVLYERRMVQ